MLTFDRSAVTIFVDRVGNQWIVRDAQGLFWSLPVGEEPWQRREPFDPAEDAQLEPVPGHYKYLLGLPL